MHGRLNADYNGVTVYTTALRMGRLIWNTAGAVTFQCATIDSLLWFHYQLTVWIVVNVHLGFLPHRPWISIDRRHCEAEHNPPMQTCQYSLNETSCAHTFKTRENLLGQRSAVFTSLDAFNDDRKLKVPLREALTVFSSGLRVRENTSSHLHGANNIIVLKMLYTL